MTIVLVVRAIADAVGLDSVAIVGAVARNAWAPPRATTDLDLSVLASAETVGAAERALEGLGLRCVRRQQADPGERLPDLLVFRRDGPEVRQVGLLVAKTAFEREALARAVVVDLPGTAMRVATPEDHVVYKLIAFRPRDIDDILAVARTQARAGRPFDWASVSTWAAFWAVEDRLARIRAELEP